MKWYHYDCEYNNDSYSDMVLSEANSQSVSQDLRKDKQDKIRFLGLVFMFIKPFPYVQKKKKNSITQGEFFFLFFIKSHLTYLFPQ